MKMFSMNHPMHWVVTGFLLVVAATLGRSAIRSWLNITSI